MQDAGELRDVQRDSETDLALAWKAGQGQAVLGAVRQGLDWTGKGAMPMSELNDTS